jgi:hypothetical protein
VMKIGTSRVELDSGGQIKKTEMSTSVRVHVLVVACNTVK